MPKPTILEQESQFQEVLHAIQQAKAKAYSNINKELISLYWDIGRYISQRVEKKLWGKSVVENLANYILRPLHESQTGFLH